MRPDAWFRRLAHGACAGALLSVLRAPLGLDWTQIAVVSASSAALFRAAALLAVSLSLDALRPAFHGGLKSSWCWALAAGYALHALVLDATPQSRAGYALVLVAGTVVLRALAGPRRGAEGPAAPDALAFGERLGLVLAGLGAAVALETLARELRLFGLGTRADDALAATVFLALVALAASAFGPLLVRAASERARTAAGIGLAAGACVVGLLFLAQLSPDGLHGYLTRFEALLGPVRGLDSRLGGPLGLTALPMLDGASIGTLWTGGLLAAAALVVPAFVLGATVGATRHAGRLAHALAGAAVGLVLLPALVRSHGRPLAPADLGGASFAWDLVAAGALAAALGALAPALDEARGRAVRLALAAAVALVPWARPRLVAWSFSPWAPARIEPELVWPTPEGLLTVERARDGLRVLTLDRRRLTPLADEEEDDGARLALAFALLPPERRAGPVRALLLGQLTPARAHALARLGVAELDRSAPWHAAMPRIEELLFDGAPVPGGAVLAPAAARAGLDDGRYDWVVAPPVHGPVLSWKSEARALYAAADAPRMLDLDLAQGTVGTAWIALESPAEDGAELAPLLVAPGKLLETLALGLVRGGPRDAAAPVGPLLAVPAYRGPTPLALLSTMPQQRAFAVARAWTTSVAPEPAPDVVRGLALHFGAQRLSSPYETREQQVEIDEDALRAFFAAVPAEGAGLDDFTRVLWSTLAQLFVAKRTPEHTLVYVEPVAERFAPWPVLDQAVAIAYREVLDPASAEPFLARARAARPLDIGLLVEHARLARELGDDDRAVAFLEQALALQPGRPDLERELGLVLLASGDDARGRELAERALRADPDDAEVRRALGLEPPADDDPR